MAVPPIVAFQFKMMALSHVRARVTLIVSHGGKAKVQGSGAVMRQKSWRHSSGAGLKITQWVQPPAVSLTPGKHSLKVNVG